VFVVATVCPSLSIHLFESQQELTLDAYAMCPFARYSIAFESLEPIYRKSSSRTPRTIADSRFNDSASTRLEADDEDSIEWALSEDEREAAALLKRIATIKRAIIRPQDAPKAAVNLICPAG